MTTYANGYLPEYKLMRLRECELAKEHRLCDTPAKVAEIYDNLIKGSPRFTEEQETLVVLMLNTRRELSGFSVISTGTLDTLLVHPREVFRQALIAGASAIIIIHNHPSGDPTPSEADIKVTRSLIQGGQLLKVDVVDHVIMGEPRPDRAQPWVSLREMGYFFS